MDIELEKIDAETAEKVAEYLESIEYNESYIYHFLEEADRHENPAEYIKNKFPDALK